MRKHTGNCLCGKLQYAVEGTATFPHLCSCHMCQRWSGAPTVAWVEFPTDKVKWIGEGGRPSLYRSSEKTQRGFCPNCGGTVCALDDGYDKISITIASLDDPSLIVPNAQHSYSESAPSWWKVSLSSKKISATVKKASGSKTKRTNTRDRKRASRSLHGRGR
jgi:hypothetical protein